MDKQTSYIAYGAIAVIGGAIVWEHWNKKASHKGQHVDESELFADPGADSFNHLFPIAQTGYRTHKYNCPITIGQNFYNDQNYGVGLAEFGGN